MQQAPVHACSSQEPPEQGRAGQPSRRRCSREGHGMRKAAGAILAEGALPRGGGAARQLRRIPRLHCSTGRGRDKTRGRGAANMGWEGRSWAGCGCGMGCLGWTHNLRQQQGRRARLPSCCCCCRSRSPWADCAVGLGIARVLPAPSRSIESPLSTPSSPSPAVDPRSRRAMSAAGPEAGSSSSAGRAHAAASIAMQPCQAPCLNQKQCAHISSRQLLPPHPPTCLHPGQDGGL